MLKMFNDDLAAAVRDIPDGATVMVGGFGSAGEPRELVEALIEQGASHLTVINNNAANNEFGLGALLAAGRVDKVICSYPRLVRGTAATTGSNVAPIFDQLYEAGKIELELVAQGTLAERIRAGGAGIGGFFTRTAYGTELAEGKETRVIDGKGYVFEQPLRADYALVRAAKADRVGNLTYNHTARNFGPLMLMAADTTIVQVPELVDVGAIDPEVIVSPGIYVDRLVVLPRKASEVIA